MAETGPGGVEWRHPTRDDVPAWTALLQACEAVDETGENYVDDDLYDEYDEPARHPEHAWFGFEGETLVAFGWAVGRPTAIDFHRVQLAGAVHPEWRRRGIGSFLVGRLEDAGRAVHAALHPDADGVLELHCNDRNQGKVALAERAGYEPLRYWYEMRRAVQGDLPAIDVPAGLELRTYSRDLDDEIRVANNEAFQDHWGSTPRSEDEWQLFSVGRHFEPTMSFALMEGTTVAASLISHHYPADAAASGHRDGWISIVGTRRPWRGRGAARALITAALTAYRDAGFDYAMLGVDAANPTGALGLYERLGFEPVESAISYTKPA